MLHMEDNLGQHGGQGTSFGAAVGRPGDVVWPVDNFSNSFHDNFSLMNLLHGDFGLRYTANFISGAWW